VRIGCCPNTVVQVAVSHRGLASTFFDREYAACVPCHRYRARVQPPTPSSPGPPATCIIHDMARNIYTLRFWLHGQNSIIAWHLSPAAMSTVAALRADTASTHVPHQRPAASLRRTSYSHRQQHLNILAPCPHAVTPVSRLVVALRGSGPCIAVSFARAF
jgi:hypothetical protein